MRDTTPNFQTALVPIMHALLIIIWDWGPTITRSIKFSKYPSNIDVSSRIRPSIYNKRGIQMAITPPTIMVGGTRFINLELLSGKRGMRPMVTGRTYHIFKSTSNLERGSLRREESRELLIATIERNSIGHVRSLNPMSQQILQVIHFQCNLFSL